MSWGKAEQRGPAPVVAYKVDAWLLGEEGGARWVEVKKEILINCQDLLLEVKNCDS